MIGYVTLGTNDLPRAAAFYDAIAKHFGVGRMMEFDTFIAWGDMNGAPGVAATKPFDEKEATVGNGTRRSMTRRLPTAAATKVLPDHAETMAFTRAISAIPMATN